MGNDVLSIMLSGCYHYLFLHTCPILVCVVKWGVKCRKCEFNISVASERDFLHFNIQKWFAKMILKMFCQFVWTSLWILFWKSRLKKTFAFWLFSFDLHSITYIIFMSFNDNRFILKHFFIIIFLQYQKVLLHYKVPSKHHQWLFFTNEIFMRKDTSAFIQHKISSL